MLGLSGEVLVYDAWVSSTLDGSTKDWEQVVTKCQVVTSLGALPFANRWLLLSFDSGSFLMTLIVNKVAMGHCRVSLCLRSAAFAVPVFKAESFREYIHAENIARLGRVAFLTSDTFWPFLFFHVLHFHKEVCCSPFFLQTHLGRSLGFPGSQELLFFLLVNNLL